MYKLGTSKKKKKWDFKYFADKKGKSYFQLANKKRIFLEAFMVQFLWRVNGERAFKYFADKNKNEG